MKISGRALLAALALPLATWADSAVVFNEIMYHPAGTNEAALEWIELHNQHAVDIDLSGWRLDGGIDFNFAEGTVLRAGGFLVVAAAPTNLIATIGATNVIGPFRNRLSNDGDTLRLRNNDSRIIDEVHYGTEGDWPVAPDGSGPSLIKRADNVSSGDSANWRASYEMGGSPGRANLPTTTITVNTTSRTLLGFQQPWRFNQDAVDLGPSWRMPGDTTHLGWASGSGVFAVEDCGCLPFAIATPLSLVSSGNGQRVRTYYFRRDLAFAGANANVTLGLRTLVDDGMVLYLNGVEIFRQGMPIGPIDYSTLATGGVGEATVIGPTAVSVTNLLSGQNVLAAEVHQVGDNSTDIVFDLEMGELTTMITTNLPSGYSAPPAAISFNEFSSATNTAFWVEILNHGATNFDLGGAILARFGGATNREYVFPPLPLAPGQFLQLTRNELGFGADPGDRLVLFSPGRASVLDALVAKREPRARQPDGAGRWLFPTVSTPGASNRIDFRDDVVINEIFYHAPPQPAQAAVVTNEIVLPATGFWRWFAEGSEPSGSWMLPGYDDSGWEAGNGVFLAPTNLNVSVPKGTRLPLTNTLGERIVTFYFRTQFNFPGATSGLALTLRPVVDDGAVFYLNGVEVYRANLPSAPAPIAYNTLALTNAGLPGFGPAVTLPPGNVVPGLNSLAVEVHQVVPNSSDVAFGCELAATRELSPGHPYRDSTESWIELYNRGTGSVSLAGWRLDEGIDFRFASNTAIGPGGYLIVAKDVDAMRNLHPALFVVGPFTNQLSRNGERIVLKDPANNPADEVHYFSGGSWSERADAGGSSLELRDLRADHANAAAWAASDESAKSVWQTYTYRGFAAPAQPGEPTLWHELAFCLLDGAGEVLLDDIRVVENPATAPKELIREGGFTVGSAVRWRFLGNHRLSRIEPEPGNPGNYVLHLIATGAGEYQGNQIETTLTNNVSIVNGREYEISFQAKWIAGKNLLNTRLYFNRLARTFALSRPMRLGTPGGPNSRRVANLGPTFSNLIHTPVVPNPLEPVSVSAQVADPDGLGSFNLRYAVNGGPWQSVAMTVATPAARSSRVIGMIPGQASAAIVQFYIEGRDVPGASAFAPAGGTNSRALYTVQDSRATASAHNFRLILTPADGAFLHTATNALSNELLGSTVIYDEREVYYDVGVRLKGSFVGRNVDRVGFHCQFPNDALFRGEHRIVSVDRSQHTIAGSVAEIVIKHIAGHAGGVPTMYDDIARFIHPAAPSYTSMSALRLTGFDGDWLDAQFDHGADGSVFEVEVLRWHTATVDGNPESPKQVGPNSYANLEAQNYGDTAENYRWFLLKVNNRTEDAYAGGIAWCQTLGLTGVNFEAQAARVLDVDQWLRVLAYQSLVGPGDAYYTGANIHNFRIFVRPDDGRVMYLPWDWDSAFQASTAASLFGGGNISKLLQNPHNRRQYLSHMNDVVRTTFNSSYMARWTAHYGAVAGQDFSSLLSYINSRANFVLGQLPTAAFAITNNGGNNFSATNGLVVLGGSAPMSVNQIEVNGIAYAVTWISDTIWRLTVPLPAGATTLTVVARDRRGVPVAGATDSITVTNTGPAALLPVVINEWMADNAAPGGFPDPADGQYQDWIELFNPNPVSVNLGGYHLTDNLSVPTKYTLPTNTVVAAHGFLLVWADEDSGQTALIPNGDRHANFRLDGGGEAIALFAPDGVAAQHAVVFGSQLQGVSQGLFPDGVTNALRFMTNWTPRRPNQPDLPAPPGVVAFSILSDDRVRLEFRTIPGRTYRVETKPDLDASAWAPVAMPIRAAAALTEFTEPLTLDSRRFYRVLLLQ